MRPSLDLELTRRCNLRCDYCFVGWSRDWHSDIPVDIALGIVEEGAGLFPVLHITGGEPFAYRAIFEVIEAALAKGYEEVMINTNGTMLSSDAMDRLASYGPRVAISVSLDGPEPIHDAARGQGRFREAHEGLRGLLARGVRSTVMSVVTPEVLRGLVPFLYGLMEGLPGLSGVTLFPVGVGPEGSQKPGVTLRGLTPDEIRELALAVTMAYRSGIPVGISTYPIVNPLLLALGYPASMLYHCTAGRGRVGVHADLTVSTCHPVKEPVYGTYRPGLLRQLSSFEVNARLARRDYDGCRSCEHKEECGHCRAFVASSGAPLFGNDEVCLDVVPRSPAGSALAPSKKRVSLPVL
jgi:radical SAM protein with 4Fe4S-binding SPASM domain